jgi:CheY-like chemotaxis protein
MRNRTCKAPPPVESPPAEHGAPSLNILVVDDNPINRQILELFLDHLGAKCISVENGLEAVEAAALQPFDAILMDIRMPEMDGLTATREIRRRERAARAQTTPIIVVSANCEPEDIAAAHAAGAQMHVAKPITMATLFTALSVACDPEQRESHAA